LETVLQSKAAFYLHDWTCLHPFGVLEIEQLYGGLPEDDALCVKNAFGY